VAGRSCHGDARALIKSSQLLRQRERTDEKHGAHNQEQKKQKLGDARGGTGDARKPEHRRDQSDDEKYDSPTQHEDSSCNEIRSRRSLRVSEAVAAVYEPPSCGMGERFSVGEDSAVIDRRYSAANSRINRGPR
jgi:hypothetical protein